MGHKPESDHLDTYIARNMAHQPIEAKIVRKVVKALKENNTPVVKIWDGEESVNVSGIKQINRVVFNLDEAFLYTTAGSWVRIVLGNGWDCLVDYNISLEDALKPVNDYIEKNW